MDTLAPYLRQATSLSTLHIFSYGILSGTTIWHTFINGPLAYKTLPRQQFGALQKRLFPTFFTLQTVTGAFCAWTSYIAPASTWNEVVALSVVATSGLLNLLLIGPWTTRIMDERHKLERSTNTKYTDTDISPDMSRLNLRFGIAHSVSSIVNLAALGGILAQTVHLGARLHD
ncbi:hypothetical protein BCR37DRAFT_385427 [Protomyces lactucae-debilis]|uniref:TMEM205-like domain-containing protein n=1 Tax=Protomyces lactucae-debilis TaxID=2754530 RepID=A0A1Y2FUY1_PROLT|nr:uncharacterized protein BCR37DRAFT_385427 [Protomyces lactucae-debilis]ORY86986.1 hypothetical protein BCR37DRAFT_385427 [Protomyces lactucae-debilis]